MKEIEIPIAGNLFFYRQNTKRYGVIVNVDIDNVAGVKELNNFEVTFKSLGEQGYGVEFTDFAFHVGGIENSYVYLDVPYSEKNVFLMQFKYSDYQNVEF